MKIWQEYQNYFKQIGAYDHFLDYCLDYDYGKVTPMYLPITMKEFLNSEYAEKIILNRFSAKIVEYEKTEELKQEIEAQNITDYNNNRNLDMIFNCSKEFLQSIHFYYTVTALAFSIDRKSAIKFLNRTANSRDFMEALVYRCGLNNRPSFYSGRGVVYSDLNDRHLLAIYQKLERIDKEKAIAMVKMTLAMPTLGATEFLNSLYALAENNFDLETTKRTEDNIDINVVGEEERNMVAFASIFALNSDEEKNKRQTRNIQKSFLYDLPDEVKEEINNCVDYPKQKRKDRMTIK